MNGIEIALVSLASAIGAAIGTNGREAFAALHRRARRRTPQADPEHGEELDPLLAQRVRDASQAWAARTGRPEVAQLAAGYLEDAAREAQKRWRNLP